MVNRLASQTSPYLLQHKDNPVDWYPWGPEAFADAHRRDVPVLLSIGYAACHWCHVMERESFEDADTARVMNDLFVSIKVDREERPDVDSIYMEAVQAMTGHGGWPMTVFLTHDGRAFYGGTYFPPEDRAGMPSFTKVLTAVAETWRQKRDEVETQADKLTEHLRAAQQLQPSERPVTDEVLVAALSALRQSFDSDYGGFGSAPKFPQPMVVDFLLRMHRRGRSEAGEMAQRTLDAMAAGGMFDQLAGGFARYSVDRLWLVPHFEKMLYDNAQLLRSYARSSLATGSEHHRRVAEMTVSWLLSEMRDEGGGFWSSLDADSEGVEGKFYVFSFAEVRAAVGDEDLEFAAAHLGFTEEGNFEGSNIPVQARAAADPDRLERVRAALLAHRDGRVRPGTDTKVLAGWNALTAAALAESGAAFGHREWVEAAVAAMRFVLDRMRVDGRLMRSYRKAEDGSEAVAHLGVAEDYAFVLEACLALYEATFEVGWLDEARWAADQALTLFHDDAAGGFFSTGKDGEHLVLRPKDLIDNAVPSANSVFALELQRLSHLTGEVSYGTIAESCIQLLREQLERAPLGFGHLLNAADFYLSEPAEVMIVTGPEGGEEGLLRSVRANWIPNKVVALAGPGDDEALKRIPLLEGRQPQDGRSAAYVCRSGTCRMPVDEPRALEEQLGV